VGNTCTSGVAEKLAGSVARAWLVMLPAVLFNSTLLLLEEGGVGGMRKGGRMRKGEGRRKERGERRKGNEEEGE